MKERRVPRKKRLCALQPWERDDVTPYSSESCIDASNKGKKRKPHVNCTLILTRIIHIDINYIAIARGFTVGGMGGLFNF
jgi:hypothetical protein